MLTKINKYIGCKIRYEGVECLVKNVKQISTNITLYTDKRTWVLLPSQVEYFLETVHVLDEPSNMIVVKEVEGDVRVAQATSETTIGNRADKVSDGLLAMFDSLSEGKPSKESLEKAKAMFQVANAIVSVEKIKLDYYNLLKK
ncbi:hypothetical protein [Myroides odoratus]|uniref:hypothetical protein n=1 Tax=Myroides odoratus TaxID=256 RepID=UPI0039AEB670